MLKTKPIALLVANLLVLAPALAGGDGTTSPVNLVMYFNGHDGVLVRQDQMIDPDACGRRDFYILSKSHPTYKEMSALIVSSHLTGQPLGFHVSGCVQGIPSIVHVQSTK